MTEGIYNINDYRENTHIADIERTTDELLALLNDTTTN